jgi:hypothetical protein
MVLLYMSFAFVDLIGPTYASNQSTAAIPLGIEEEKIFAEIVKLIFHIFQLT